MVRSSASVAKSRASMAAVRGMSSHPGIVPNLGTGSMGMAMNQIDPRCSVLCELPDKPGALFVLLSFFWKHEVQLTAIESRPVTGSDQTMTIQMSFAGSREDPIIQKLVTDMSKKCRSILVLDEKVVPWFPRHISDLDLIANRTLDAGGDLESDHPGFNDPTYRERRAKLAEVAQTYRWNEPIPYIDYEQYELDTWGAGECIFRCFHFVISLSFHIIYPLSSCVNRTMYCVLHMSFLIFLSNGTWFFFVLSLPPVYDELEKKRHLACREYREILPNMEKHCGYSNKNIPQAQDISMFLQQCTGFRLRPVAGLLSSRDFLNGLAFRVFFSTQYIRHSSRPLYTPEPDICHELLGHAPMFADPAFADFSQEVGLASLGASDDDIKRLATCYWHTVEFGLLKENGELRAYGAGVLSSFGEMSHACENVTRDDAPTYLPWNPEVASRTDYPITTYQPTYFVAESLADAKNKLIEFTEQMPKPFYARYNALTQTVWVDKHIQREKDSLSAQVEKVSYGS